MTEWEGVLPLWKDAGMTSHDCVARTRKLLKMKRIGHTGTLDPDVSGVLPLCLGRATRIVEYLQDLPKVYDAELTIGYATDTEDASGAITERADHVRLTDEQIKAAIRQFVGTIEQTPPMYSAVKIAGRRLYDIAREGQVIERPSRKVTIYSIDIRSIDLDGIYPKVAMKVVCSKGTYIRTLCTDIGRSLGLPAVMSALIRTGSGSIPKERCVTLLEVERHVRESTLSSVIVPVSDALDHLAAGVISDNAMRPALQGRKLYAAAVQLSNASDSSASGLVRLFGNDPDACVRRFVGLYRTDEESGDFIPQKLFL